MSRHTPRPWATNGGLIGTYIEGRKNWTLVADSRDDGGSSMESGEAEANTNLIAAAPDLLIALEALLADAPASGLMSVYLARDAIAKAKGESK